MRRTQWSVWLGIVALGVAGMAVRAASQPPLTLEMIARDFRWYTRGVAIDHWSDDGKRLYYRVSGKTEEDPSEYWEVTFPGRKLRRLTEEEIFRLTPGGVTSFGGGFHERRQLWSPDGARRVATREGDLLLVETSSGKARQLTFTPSETESAPRFLQDGERIAFERGGNVFVLSLKDDTLRQATDFRTGKKPEEPDAEPKLKNDQQKNLRKQQFELFESLRKARARRKRDAERNRRRRKVLGRPEPYYVPEGKRIQAPTLSPGGKWVTFVLVEPYKDSKPTVVPRYVTESGFTETPAGRTKVGEARAKQTLMVYEVATGKVRTCELPKNGKGFMYSRPKWSPDGKRCLLTAHSEDLKDRWVLGVDVPAAKGHLIDDWHDPAWIGGPGPEGAYWLPDSQRVYFLSEISGWSQLYVAPFGGGQAKQLTSGRFEVSRAQLSRDGKRFYLLTNEAHPGERNLYAMPVEGGERTRLTTRLEGINSCLLSPDEQRMALTFSTVVHPAELGVMKLRPGAKPKQLTHLTTKEFLSRKWIRPQIVTLPDKDGNKMYARLYLPKKPHPLHPAVIQVHGAGYAQAAHKRWSGGLFLANYLAEQGYVVLDLDYRGSAGYGRDCRTAIYRHMGGADIDSALAAVDYLVAKQGVSRERVGITGGSYGGFFTLMALFTHPGVFKAGAAYFPVTDWAHYNHWYTSRILNLPTKDSEAYKRSSPIFLAQGLQDRLLILHGLSDTNVHAQDTIRLVQRLIELKKTGWEFDVYPREGHGFRLPASRLDGYRRTVALFDSELKKSATDTRRTAR